MKKIAIIVLIATLLFASIFAYGANKYYNFTQSEMETLRNALTEYAQLEADVAQLEAYLNNPTYDKTAARQALASISSQASELSDALDIVNAKLTGEGVTYVLNLSNRKYHLQNCAYISNIVQALYYTGTYEELEAMGYEACKFCKPNEAQ